MDIYFTGPLGPRTDLTVMPAGDDLLALQIPKVLGKFVTQRFVFMGVGEKHFEYDSRCRCCWGRYCCTDRTTWFRSRFGIQLALGISDLSLAILNLGGNVARHM